MKYHFGNVLVSSQEYAIYTGTFKDPGCTATRKTGNYPETTIVQVKSKSLAKLSCRSWLTHSGLMGTQSMPEYKHWLSGNLQNILGFIYMPRCVGLNKTGKSGVEAVKSFQLHRCSVMWSQGLCTCKQVVMNLGTFGCMIVIEYRNCFTALGVQRKDYTV